MEQHHFDIVNHATPRLESMDKALGRGKYTDDLELPNMAYAALVRCPYSHAKVLSIARRKRFPVFSAAPCRRRHRRPTLTARATRPLRF